MNVVGKFHICLISGSPVRNASLITMRGLGNVSSGVVAEPFALARGGARMRVNFREGCICLLMVLLAVNCIAQKVKVGYDKGTDFSKFRSYSWAEPATPPTRPLLYASVVGSIDSELTSKGLVRTEHDGDLILIPAGGMDFGINVAVGDPIVPTRGGSPAAINSTMWTGATGFSNLTAPYVTEGALILTFIDRLPNKVVWTGSVTEKLDITQKNKSLKLINKSIVKLLKQFPPNKK